jgi:Cadherin domain
VEFANSLEGTLVLRKPLDFESERELNVSIRAQDQGNPPLYNETYVIIRVQDADDQNPLFSRPRYVAYLPQPAVKVIHLCKFLHLNSRNCSHCSHWSRSST